MDGAVCKAMMLRIVQLSGTAPAALKNSAVQCVMADRAGAGCPSITRAPCRNVIGGALKRCRVLADQIESRFLNGSREFVDKGSLADFYASLQRAADVLGQESRKSVEDTLAPTVKGLRAGAISATDN
jgi:hypothetical protein